MSDQAINSTDIAALERRVAEVTARLAALRRKLMFSTIATGIIGTALCVLLVCYLGFFYIKARRLTEPKYLTQVLGTVITDRIPELRKALESQVKQSANEWAKAVSDQLLKNMPEARPKLEELIMKAAEQAASQAISISAQKFGEVVDKHHQMFKDGFQSLKDPEKAKEFTKGLEEVLEQEFGAEIRTHARLVLDQIIRLNYTLKKLARGQDLNTEERQLRDILKLAMRLYDETRPEKERARPAITASVQPPVKPAAATKPTEKAKPKPPEKPKPVEKKAAVTAKPKPKAKPQPKPEGKPKLEAKPAPKAEKPAPQPKPEAKAPPKPPGKPKQPAEAKPASAKKPAAEKKEAKKE